MDLERDTLKNYLHSNLFLGLLTVFLAWLILLLRDVLFIVFIAFLITLAILPLVRLLRHWKFPRTLVVILLLAVLIGFIAGLAYLAVPAFVHQLGALVSRLTSYIDRILPIVKGQHLNLLQAIQGYLDSAGNSLIKVSTVAFGVVGSTISVIVISLYWVLDYDSIKKSGIAGLGPESQKIVKSVMHHIEKRLGSWLRGQLLLSLSVALLFLIAYLILGLPAAFVLAVLAGVFEIVPLVGPVLAAIPALLIALSISTHAAVGVLIAYVIVHLLEGHLLAPRIMGHTVGLPPLLIIVALLVGANLAGIIGIVMAIPVGLTVISIVEGIQEAT